MGGIPGIHVLEMGGKLGIAGKGAIPGIPVMQRNFSYFKQSKAWAAFKFANNGYQWHKCYGSVMVPEKVLQPYSPTIFNEPMFIL